MDGYTTQITKYPDGSIRPMGYPRGYTRRGGGMMAGYALPMAAPMAAAPVAANALAVTGAVAKRSSAPMAMADGAAQNEAEDSAGGGVGSGGASVRLQSDFVVTPLFAVVTTGDDGVATLPFKAPSNLGTFVIRAYVASPENGESPTQYGASDSSVVVRRPVSLVPSIPRITRTGDLFEAGVIISAPGSPEVTKVTVTASLVTKNGSAKAVVLQSGAASDSATVPVAGGGQQELRFKFVARQVRGHVACIVRGG